ncbi:MAG: hypothetical protein GWP10_19925 [Nitrospiraceae bacterium]|nr:hypothetical protein [Nitrospiraceae bacterium]
MNQIEGKNWLIGAAFGIIGALIGGYIWAVIAMKTGTMYGIIALISAGLAGVGFGIPTRGGSNNIRGLIGAILGLTSIILGYYFIYISPINLGAQSIPIVPAKYMSFEEYWSIIVDPIDYLFLIIGIYEGYKFGSV